MADLELAELAQDDQTLRPEVVGIATGSWTNVELDILSIHYQNSMLVDTKPLIERC
jgi:hypothetical protein